MSPKIVRQPVETGEENEQKEAEALLAYQEQIAALAYKLWHDRGCPEGSPDADWFEAEELVRTRENSTAR